MPKRSDSAQLTPHLQQIESCRRPVAQPWATAPSLSPVRELGTVTPRLKPTFFHKSYPLSFHFFLSDSLHGSLPGSFLLSYSVFDFVFSLYHIPSAFELTLMSTCRIVSSTLCDSLQSIAGCLQAFTKNSLIHTNLLITVFILRLRPRFHDIVTFVQCP